MADTIDKLADFESPDLHEEDGVAKGLERERVPEEFRQPRRRCARGSNPASAARRECSNQLVLM